VCNSWAASRGDVNAVSPFRLLSVSRARCHCVWLITVAGPTRWSRQTLLAGPLSPEDGSAPAWPHPENRKSQAVSRCKGLPVGETRDARWQQTFAGGRGGGQARGKTSALAGLRNREPQHCLCAKVAGRGFLESPWRPARGGRQYRPPYRQGPGEPEKTSGESKPSRTRRPGILPAGPPAGAAGLTSNRIPQARAEGLSTRRVQPPW